MELDYEPLLDIFALFYLCMLAYFFFEKEKIYTETSRFYGMMLISVFVNVFFDTISVWTITYSREVPLWLNHIVNVPIFISNIAIPVSFMKMCMSMTGKIPAKTEREKRILNIVTIPSIVGMLIAATTPLTGFIYYFDADMRYRHGQLYIWLYVLMAFYTCIGVISVIRHRENVGKIQRIILYVYLCVAVISMLVQYMFPRYLVIGAAMTLSLLSMYMTFQNPDSYIDKQTGIFNRDAFLIKTSRIFRHNNDDSVLIAVCLTGLKSINNQLGFSSGDELIVIISQWLSFVSPEKNKVFRTGGSIFAVITENKKAEILTETIRERLSGTWKTKSGNIHVPFAICSMDVRDRAFDQKEMMKLFENVIEMARGLDDGTYINIDENTVVKVARRARIEELLRGMKDNGCVSLYWQPIYAVKNRRITHVEVLMRMNDKKLGYIPPDEFISVAEQSGAILGLGLWVLDNTCKFIEENRVWEHGLRIIAVNLSMMECIQPNAAEQILGVLEKYPRARHYIGLEITETTLATSSEAVIEMMNELSEQGVQFALDDYGCGWSNCESVIKFPFTSIKMDKGLLWSAMKDARAMILYRNCVRMFKEMGLMVVSEGAESEEHLKFLEDVGADFIQGYYFSKPLPEEEFLKLADGENAVS